MKKVVLIGGSGIRNTLKALLPIKDISIKYVVSVFDSGGSTGYLRQKYGIFAVGDLRDGVLAASNNKPLVELSEQRVEIEGIKHSIGNLLILAAIEKYKNNYLNVLTKIFKTSKKVQFIPATSDIFSKSNLVIRTNKGIFYGEANLDDIRDKDLRIEDISLDPPAQLNPDAYEAIKNADFIIFGPGDVYSSILPVTLTIGFKEAINQSKGKRILIANIMRKIPESINFNVSNFINLFENRGLHLDYVIVNTRKIPGEDTIFSKYAMFSGFVELDTSGPNIIKGDLVNEKIPYEHDPQKLSKLLKLIIS